MACGEELAKRFNQPVDPFRVIMVRNMWLTGFDVPSLHSMYAGKPRRGHGRMQAIAHVNRVFRDNPGGMVVDYLGLRARLAGFVGDDAGLIVGSGGTCDNVPPEDCFPPLGA